MFDSDTLPELFWVMKQGGANGHTYALWAYVMYKGPREFPVGELQGVLSLHERQVRAHIEVLCSLGFIERRKQVGKATHMEALNPSRADIYRAVYGDVDPGRSDPGRTPSLVSLDYSSLEEHIANLGLSSLSRPSKTRKGLERGDARGKNARGQESEPPSNIQQVKSSSTWQKAQEFLYTEFEKAEVPLKYLLNESMFNRLKALVHDDSFNFGLYCRWYREKKYKRLKFKWNMFLLKTMLEEFRGEQEEYRQEAQEYMASMRPDLYWRDEERLESALQDKKWIEENIPEVEGFE